MPTTLTVSSGSERVVVYPEGTTKRPAPTPPVHSPTSSGRRSFSSSANSDDWTELEAPYEDDIEPSDSASRSRQPTSRRATTEGRPAAARRHSSRRIERAEELPRRSSQRHTVSDHPRRRRYTESRQRVPSDESASTLSSHDDYPHSHRGPPPRHYPSGYRHVAAAGQGGYPPSMTPAVPGYAPDPFNPQALVHMPQNDPFGYPSANPFQPPSSHGNPFSPMSTTSGASGYFQTDPMAPPQMPHHGRPHGPPRPQSYAGPSAYGSELMHTPYGYGAQFAPYGMPGYPNLLPQMYPPSHVPTAPAPKEEREPPKKDTGELDALKALIQKHEEDMLAREKAMVAKAEADAAAAAAAKAKEEAEKKTKEEVADASKKAKEAAEKDATEKAKKTKEEADKKLGEATKAKEEAEKAKKALEAEIEKNKPTPDSQKAPIKFKDAVGRKFSFPWHLCKTWKGMEGLIRQAFLHVDIIGQEVQQGHYDLTGPDGEIILPQVWETMIQPDWEISMHMWPMEDKKKEQEDKLTADLAMFSMTDPLAQYAPGDFAMDVGNKSKKDRTKGEKKKHRSGSSNVIDVGMAGPSMPNGGIPVPPPHGLPMNFPGMPPLPPGMSPMAMGLPPMPMPGYDMPGGQPSKSNSTSRYKSKSKSSKELPFLATWMAGGAARPSKKGDEKLELARTHSHREGGGDNGQTACAVM